MLNLPRPTSFYFETCRQIVWARLTFDKLYILYSDAARDELVEVWCAAIARAMNGTPFSTFSDILDTALQQDDDEWSEFVRTIERYVELMDVIDDYFLGEFSAEELVTEIEGGAYRGA